MSLIIRSLKSLVFLILNSTIFILSRVEQEKPLIPSNSGWKENVQDIIYCEDEQARLRDFG